MRRLSWLVAVVALAVYLVATGGHGLGVSLDSVVYARAAKSVLDDGTLAVPLTRWDSDERYEPLSHFPPLLPLTLAAVGHVLHVDMYSAGRFVNAACLFATLPITLTAFADSAPAFLLMAALLAGPSFFTMHLWLWSEPLFLLLVVACVLLGARLWSASPSPSGALLLGVLCGLATLTRYSGASLFAGFALLFVLVRVPFASKAKLMLGCCSAYAVTVLPWVWWLAMRSGSPRTLGFYTDRLYGGVLRPMLRTMVGWFLPSSLPLPVALMLTVVGLGALALACVRRARTRDDFRIGPTAIVAATLLVTQLCFLVIARVVADPGMPFDERILAAAMVLVAFVLADVSRALLATRLTVVAGAIIACVALVNVAATAPQVAYARYHGLGYAADEWRHSETIAWLRGLEPNVTIFSNAPDAICASLPVTAKYTPANYETDQLTELAVRIAAAAPSVVVLFDDPHAGWLLERDRLRDALEPAPVRQLADGIVMSWGEVGGR